jgi:hypothetical protein
MFIEGKRVVRASTTRASMSLGLACDAEGCRQRFWPKPGSDNQADVERRARNQAWRVDPEAPEGWQHFCIEHAADCNTRDGGPMSHEQIARAQSHSEAAADAPGREAFIQFDGWAGRYQVRVLVIGETAKRWRGRLERDTKLPGRGRRHGETVLVPKNAVSFAMKDVPCLEETGR